MCRYIEGLECIFDASACLDIMCIREGEINDGVRFKIVAMSDGIPMNKEGIISLKRMYEWLLAFPVCHLWCFGWDLKRSPLDGGNEFIRNAFPLDGF